MKPSKKYSSDCDDSSNTCQKDVTSDARNHFARCQRDVNVGNKADIDLDSKTSSKTTESKAAKAMINCSSSSSSWVE